jgi:uncharacterized protein YwgA
MAEPIAGRTRLMKMVFLFDKELRRDFELGKVIADEAIPRFEAFDYGPFSANVYSDIEFLVGLNFITVTSSGEEVPEEEEAEYEYWSSGDADEGDFTFDIFALSALGRKFVEAGRAGKLSDDQWRVLDTFKARCTSTSLRTLLQYVYAKYPETTTKSKIRSQVLSSAHQ